MIGLEGEVRPARARFSASLALVALVVGMATVVSLREWYVWRGYTHFLERRFAEAAADFSQVAPGRTLVGTYLKLPGLQWMYAQSLLAVGREGEALEQFADLGRRNPEDPTIAFIEAVGAWKAGNEGHAIDRLGTHAIVGSKCEPCIEAQRKFVGARTSKPKITAAREDQEKHLVAMKAPAQCLFLRAGSAASGIMLPKIVGFATDGAGRLLRQTGMGKAAANQALEIIERLVSKTLSESVGRLIGDDGAGCAKKLQLHEVLRLKEIPIVGSIEQWVEFRTLESFAEKRLYIGEVKEAWAAAPHLYELGAASVSLAHAYKAEVDARGDVEAADELVKSQWRKIVASAQEPQFAETGIVMIARNDSWFGRVQTGLGKAGAYLWPF